MQNLKISEEELTSNFENLGEGRFTAPPTPPQPLCLYMFGQKGLPV